MNRATSHYHLLSAKAFIDEADALHPLLAQIEPLASMDVSIMAQARVWTRNMRGANPYHGIETFLQTYKLNTEEGAALMCLAEALLRIPDAATADALIESTFAHRHWQRFSQTPSWAMQFSSWGLLLTGKVIDLGQDDNHGLLALCKNMIAKMGEPVIREALKHAMRIIGRQFVLGETMQDALHHAESYAKHGYRFSFDILGEGARSNAQAEAFVEAYRKGIAQIASTIPPNQNLFEAPGISVKLSALHPRYQLTQQQRVIDELLPRLKEIITLAKEAGITVAIDAEESSRLDIELLVFKSLLDDKTYDGWNGIGFVVQAYQKRGFYLIDWLAELARQHKRVIPLRLVKGAYWDSEIKWAQLQGLPSYPVFTRKEHTDISYLACADKILSCSDCFYPQFATHNARTIASIMAMANARHWQKGSFEFQRLHGMGEALHDQILGEAPSRIYAPVGPHKDLLAYLIRRLLENGANSSFVHLLMDPEKTEEEILADPIAKIKTTNVAHRHLSLPPDLYGTRQNSRGIDFGNAAQLDKFQQGIAAHAKNPLAAIASLSEQELEITITKAREAFPSWATTSVEERAAMLERAAENIEAHTEELVALLAKEARRTLADGLAEVREAADFCRYYAEQARKLLIPQALTGPVGESNHLTLHPKGIFACISPWNFPLAIFTGQSAAALVTGNVVIAKPAEQTPRIAHRAADLLYAAGIPKAALQLAYGSGKIIGQTLVANPHIAGVVFTGGTDTAQSIHRTLAARNGTIATFIAETGGQNAMVVDSSALLEQAVDDIILSAFGSAGQRCSSLRLLFVQEEIADALLHLLAGAMQELVLGDPLHPSTDIGPVIDANAQKNLFAHIDSMKQQATLIATAPLPKQNGYFVAPHLFEINDSAMLKKEIFGPVLHVVRFKSGKLQAVCDAINNTGYGLTFGIHSRIDERIRFFVSRIRAGNIYVNRSMIGATVGVQPFGGEGLSGTGPKAGGPHYLLRFLSERTLTVNTSAIGGNITLLAT